MTLEHEICPICHMLLSGGELDEVEERKVVATTCGHLFCLPCISEYISRKGGSTNCPLCNTDGVSSDSLVPVESETLAAVADVGREWKESNDDVDQETDEVMEEDGEEVRPTKRRRGANESAKSEREESDDWNKKSAKDLARVVPMELQGCAKIDEILRLVSEKLRADKTAKIIVYTQWVLMMTLIEMALDRANIPSTRYEGSMDKMKRNASLNRFRNPTGPVVLIMSLNCGSYGINLTCASHIILTDPW